MTDKIKTFHASDGKTYSGQTLVNACGAVADFYVEVAKAIYNSDPYAAHVTQGKKDEILKNSLEHAERVRVGRSKECSNLSVAQRLNIALCGECPALLP